MEVEIISEICIRPSSPTPPHLKTYKISLLDQIRSPSYIPVIFFFSNQHTNLRLSSSSKRSGVLKQSLSEALTHYYPLAGRFNINSFSIDCNDEGVPFIEARANSNVLLSEYLSQPDLSSLNSLLASNWYKPDPNRSYVTMIQETIFACGSIAVGVVASHMIMDATALASFLKCWAAIACGSGQDIRIISPNFDGPSIFPQHQPFPKDANVVSIFEPFFRHGKIATRRFVFDATTIADLKAEATTSAGVENPTRVEVVSALLCECIAAVLNERSSAINRPNAFTVAVNLRRKATPPIPQTSFGNFVWLALALCSHDEEIVCKLREATTKIDSEFVKDIRNGGFNKLHEMVKETGRDLASSLTNSKNGVNLVLMSSWCNLGLYEVDFGWGKPMWVTRGALSAANCGTPLIILMDAREDKGMEAWVQMDELDLVLLEKHEHLLRYALLNPDPLKFKRTTPN